MPTDNIEDFLNDISDPSDKPNPQQGQQGLPDDILEMMDARAGSSESRPEEPTATKSEEEIKELMVPFIRAGDFETASKIYMEQTGKGPTDAQRVIKEIQRELGLLPSQPQDRRAANLETARQIATNILREGKYEEAVRILRTRLGYTDEVARAEVEKIQRELGSSPSQLQTSQSGLPPRQPPPPPIPPPSRPTSEARVVTYQFYPGGTTNLTKLGYSVDSWSELVENMGDRAQAVQDHIFLQLNERRMPKDIKIYALDIKAGLLSSDKRHYFTTVTYPGTTTTIYVARHGQDGHDLFVAWHSFVRPVIDWRKVIVLAAFCALPTICPMTCIGIFATAIGGLVSNIQNSLPAYSNNPQYSNNLQYSPLITAGGSILVALIAWFGLFIAACTFVGLLGLYIKSDPLYFFYANISLFDIEDISAMNLSVHKSVLKALDKAGIDSKILRPKQDFRSGRRDEKG